MAIWLHAERSPSNYKSAQLERARWHPCEVRDVRSRGFVAVPDRIWLHPTEPAELGEIRGRSLCQLQCHLGLETLSWARLGASRAVGLDFSADALAIVRDVASRCGLSDRVHFVEADVHHAVSALAADAPFDIVYVSVGAICWLPSIARWAEQVAALLKADGVLYMREVHPLVSALVERDGELVINGPYFERTEPMKPTQRILQRCRT